MTESLLNLFLRDLDKLEAEISSYSNSAAIWSIPPGVLNSGGTLCLHLVGNLQHYIGAVLGGSGYVRDRDAEFGDRDVSVDEMLARIATTRNVLSSTIPALTNDVLQSKYPINVIDRDMSTELFLLHLYGHFNYHLGQINYHRRMTANE